MRRIFFIALLLVILGFISCNEKKEEMISNTVVDEFAPDEINGLSFEEPIDDLFDNLSLESPIEEHEELVDIQSLEELDELMLQYYSEASASGRYDEPAKGKKGTIEDIELLKDYLGKWLELFNGNVFAPIDYFSIDSDMFFEIFFIEGMCVFKHEYPGCQIMGYVYITEYGSLCLKGNTMLPYFILGKPFELKGKPTIFIDCDGPLGYYQLE